MIFGNLEIEKLMFYYYLEVVKSLKLKI